MRTRRALRVWLFAILCLVLVAVVWFYVRLWYDLASLADSAYTTPNRVLLANIPDVLRQATIALNDPYFYTRSAFDLRDLPRAIWSELQCGNCCVCDGVTLEDLLVLNSEACGKSVGGSGWQRTRRLLLTVMLTRRYSRDEILEMYLNLAPYGQGVYGVGTAAQHYYGKPVDDLNLAESAMLVSIADFWPYADLSQEREAFEQHQKDVLTVMVWAGYISQEEADLAAAEIVLFVH